MPAAWPNLITADLIVFALSAGLVLAGGPLLWAVLRGRPLAWRARLQAAWTLIAASAWLIVGNAAVWAHEQGLISGLACIAVIGGLFATAAGGTMLIHRCYGTND